ncbi:MAG TPA: heme biosynthesis HemY N-terminal domain-containing protein [Caulobacteraceae bacterium]|jgi:HemY protein|nr:heme biosynthesis HemY N-terminal domain-containing protein [Caulobacteraceae bacterium]
MIRGVIVFLFVLAVIAVTMAMVGDPGRASLVVGGLRVDTSAAFAFLMIGVLGLLATVFWRAVLWVAEAPRRGARARTETRRRQAAEMLSRGFLAIAAGEGAEARRCAQKASEFGDDNPALARVLAAQSAEAAGDLDAARAAYTAMLSFPEMRLVGHRGLMSIALAQGDKPAALKHAEDAYNQMKTARWAWRALFEAKLEAGQWSDALELIEGGLRRKIVTPVVAERARSALLTASAASDETSPEQKVVDHALDSATRAAKLNPGFPPAAVIAARLLVAQNKSGRAEDVIETAWAAAPHPALWLIYRDLRTNERPLERAQRLQKLVDENPDHRESRILAVEQALLAHDKPGMGEAVALLADEPVTQRLCGLYARVAWADGRADEARAWVARGPTAPPEPDWSDLDPEGRAFVYTQTDWTRLVGAWAETGELVHPRFERREKTMTDLPELPTQYEASAPFVSAAVRDQGFGAPVLPDDPGPFADALAGPADEPAAPTRRMGRKRPAALGKDPGSV